MIVNAIDKYLRDGAAGTNPDALDTAARFFRTSLERNLTAHVEEDRKHLSASSPWYCARRVLYGLNGTERVDKSPRSRLAFVLGDQIEQLGILLTRLAGVDVVSPGLDGKQQGGEISISGEPVRYHLDMEIREPGGMVVPVDWKSAAEYGYEDFTKAILDPSAKWWTEERWGYLAQIRIYMKARGVDHGYLVFCNKNTGHLAEMLVADDPAWWAELEARVEYLKAHRASDPSSLPRPSWAVSEVKPGKNRRPDGSEGPVEELKAWRCAGYCPFTTTCWPDFGVVPLVPKPKWRKAVSA